MNLKFIPRAEMDEEFIKNLHTSTFQEVLPGDFFRFDLCLVSEKEGKLYSYAMIRELDSESVEMAWGGTAVELQGYSSKKSFNLFVEKCLEEYQSVCFQCSNKNTRMIRLGILEGFTIVGTRVNRFGEMFIIFNKVKGE